MVIKIVGTRQQIAELVQEIRMQGYRFNHALQNVHPDIVKDRQCISLITSSGRMSYYKTLKPSTVYSTKELQAQLPSHRKHFLKQIEDSYVERKAS